MIIINIKKTYYKIGVSALTASILGLNKIKSNAFSNQAYLMYGTKCQNNCSFCAQSGDSKFETNFLSRVCWPQYPIDDVIEKINQSSQIKKICFQVVSVKNYFEDFIRILNIFKSKIDVPLGASINVETIEQIDILFSNGICSLGIAIDAASDEVFNRIKKKDKLFTHYLNLVKNAAKKYPAKISVHLIIGLGETDLDIFNFFKFFQDIKIVIALFAFTPIKGTEMENYPIISLKRYRFIQFLRQIYEEKNVDFSFEDLVDYIVFDSNNMIKSFDKKLFKFDFINSILDSGNYMKTSGCFLCNRPYYNDRPTNNDLYNFHFQPSKELILKWKNIIIQESC